MSSSSSVKYSLEISLLIIKRLNLHYYGIIIIFSTTGSRGAGGAAAPPVSGAVSYTASVAHCLFPFHCIFNG